MTTNNQFISGFQESASENNADLGTKFVTKSYLMDMYPYLTGMGNIQMAGLLLWGQNANGQTGTSTLTVFYSPVQTISGTNWKQIACGDSHAAGVKVDGTLWSWGYNAFGQLGNSLSTDTSSPVQTVAGGSTWQQVAASYMHTAAIKTDGTLWSWGDNTSGGLGNNTINTTSSPVQTVARGTNWKTVACGTYHTASIKTDGTLWMWGRGTSGQLGDNTATTKSSPVQTISFGTNWKQIACGALHTASIKTDGTLWMWGVNTYGQLGDNTAVNKSSPVQTVTIGSNWKQVSCGYYHTTAIKTDGSLWTWGYNLYGQLGDNTVVMKSSPVQTIALGTNWKQIVCGKEHTAAIKTDGTLWSWGRNAWGDMGDGTTVDKSSPVQTTAFGNNWKQVSGGNGFAAAIKEMGDDF